MPYRALQCPTMLYNASQCLTTADHKRQLWRMVSSAAVMARWRIHTATHTTTQTSTRSTHTWGAFTHAVRPAHTCQLLSDRRCIYHLPLSFYEGTFISIICAYHLENVSMTRANDQSQWFSQWFIAVTWRIFGLLPLRLFTYRDLFFSDSLSLSLSLGLSQSPDLLVSKGLSLCAPLGITMHPAVAA